MASHAHNLQPSEPRIVGLSFLVLAAVAVLDVVGFVAIGMRVVPGPILFIALLPVVLLGVGALYLVGGRSDRIGHTLIAVAQLIWFGSVGGIASYLMIRMGRPFIDAWLVRADMALGLDWPAYCRFIDSLGPVTSRALEVLYDSSALQVMAVAVCLGFIGQHKRLAEFVGCLILTGVVAIVVGAIIPALGAHHAYGMNTTAPFVSEIVAAHAGRVDRLDVFHMQGLVTFPSYHTVISVQIIIATWRLRLIGPVMAIINVALLIGVPIFGSHHFIDMIGGGALAGPATWLWRLRFAEPTTEKAPAAAPAGAGAVW